MKINNLEIRKVTEDSYIVTFEHVKKLGTVEYDLIVNMHRNRISNIMQGTVVAYGEFLDIEEYTDKEELKAEINEYIKIERIENMGKIRRAYMISRSFVYYFKEREKNIIGRKETLILIKLNAYDLLFDNKMNLLNPLRKDMKQGSTEAVELYNQILTY